jgi:O-antigen ligase
MSSRFNIWRERLWARRLLWSLLFVAAAAIVSSMQSRGAIFSFAAALAFVVYLLGKRARFATILVLAVCGAAVATGLVPEERLDIAIGHLTREQNLFQLSRMTGRIRHWMVALDHILRSPIIGWGFQSDRYLRIGHIHNTYLYALLASGLVGAAPFVFGLLSAWRAVFRIGRANLVERAGQQTVFVQTAGILAFFTMRSIPEVSGAMFSVDLMVMLPAIAYLSLLDRLLQARISS